MAAFLMGEGGRNISRRGDDGGRRGDGVGAGGLVRGEYVGSAV